VNRPTKETRAGQRYLDLQREAKRLGRPTDELITLYALECFLDRLTQSRFSDHFVLKGGVLLSALGARRPTRDIDFSTRASSNDVDAMLKAVCEIARITLDDGLIFDVDHATAETIRESDDYSGVRVTLRGLLSRAAVRLQVDINFGDPIWPAPLNVDLPRLLGGVLLVRGYSLEMVLAEKIVTAVTRGTANTRWRDFVDIYSLASRDEIDAFKLRRSILRVAAFRNIELDSLNSVFVGYPEIAEKKWLEWLRRQQLDTIVPTDFAAVLDFISSFADPIIAGEPPASQWNPSLRRWS